MSGPTARHSSAGGASGEVDRPWAALAALCAGFFMIMLDTTIVNIAIPAMINGLNAEPDRGHLGQQRLPAHLRRAAAAHRPARRPVRAEAALPRRARRLHPRLAACGVVGSAQMLIVARAVQGLGAAADDAADDGVHHPAVPARKRGAPMGLWGAVAGVATITGPLLGGVLVQTLGWEWIFFVNVPIGVVGRRGDADPGAGLAAPAQPQLRPDRHRTQQRRAVLRGLRPAGGAALRLGHHRRPGHRARDHRRGRTPAGGVRGVAAGQPEGAAAAADGVRHRNFSMSNLANIRWGSRWRGCSCRW